MGKVEAIHTDLPLQQMFQTIMDNFPTTAHVTRTCYLHIIPKYGYGPHVDLGST